jgi:hypothetical protein
VIVVDVALVAVSTILASGLVVAVRAGRRPPPADAGPCPRPFDWEVDDV